MFSGRQAQRSTSWSASAVARTLVVAMALTGCSTPEDDGGDTADVPIVRAKRDAGTEDAGIIGAFPDAGLSQPRPDAGADGGAQEPQRDAGQFVDDAGADAGTTTDVDSGLDGGPTTDGDSGLDSGVTVVVDAGGAP